MITTAEAFKEFMFRLLEYKIDVNGDGDEFEPDEALDRINNMDWCDYCPGIPTEFRGELPEEYLSDLNGTRIWHSDCPGFCQEGKDFIKRVFAENNIRIPLDYLNESLNNGGCTECWTHTYFLTLARFIENDIFWRVKWEEHLKKMK